MFALTHTRVRFGVKTDWPMRFRVGSEFIQHQHVFLKASHTPTLQDRNEHGVLLSKPCVGRSAGDSGGSVCCVHPVNPRYVPLYKRSGFLCFLQTIVTTFISIPNTHFFGQKFDCFEPVTTFPAAVWLALLLVWLLHTSWPPNFFRWVNSCCIACRNAQSKKEANCCCCKRSSPGVGEMHDKFYADGLAYGWSELQLHGS